MADHATSADPAVQLQLDRLAALSPGADILGLGRITALLARLGNPERRMPPVFHVAGTNGKGSTCAYLHAAMAASGRRAHVYTSPHLVRFNERIRIGGTLIEDAMLARLLAQVLDAAGDIGPSFFEVTTAAAFLAFAREPADACIIEVGLGGRLDATNVIPAPLVTGIAQLGVDHEAFLGAGIVGIAAEKAGISKPGVPLVTMRYAPEVAARVREVASAAGADWRPEGSSWSFTADHNGTHWRDGKREIRLPAPALAGVHQAANLALAIAMLRAQTVLAFDDAAFAAAATHARWPARMQRLDAGALLALLPAGAELWLDGAHNPAAAEAIVPHLAALGRDGRPLALVAGLLANKDAAGVLAPLLPLAERFIAVPVEGHACHPPQAMAELAASSGVQAEAAGDVPSGLRLIARTADPGRPPRILIMGSLYLAGSVLAENGTPPD
jgi:dihydrofolate synthase/folylpolyglutamate synthase